MLVTALSLALALHDPPGEVIAFDAITVVDARATAGTVVKATFEVSCPPDHFGRWTVLGAGLDDVERAAYVPKDLRVDKGDRVTVVGRLKVRRHTASVVNGQEVPAWDELRIDPAVRVK